MPNKNYFEYLHIDFAVDTVQKFLNEFNSPAKNFVSKPNDFLNFESIEGVSNRERIWENYTLEQKETYPNVNSVNLSAPLNQGTLLYIPKDEANNEILSIKGKNLFLEQQNLEAFIYDEFRALQNDPSYIKSDILTTFNDKTRINILHQNIQVWIYVRALDEIIDVTKFVGSISTTVTKQGGNFNMSLSPISNIDDLYYLNDTDIINYNNIVQEEEFKNPFFHRVIQQNDIVFIRFEKLDIEEDRNVRENLKITKNWLPNQIYDFIGLVDNNNLTYISNANEASVSIGGRDFMKLLQEDGAYFFPFALMEGSEDFFINRQDNDKWIKRTFVSGEYNTYFAYSLRSIRDTIGFIFNQLSNTGVLPDDVNLFSSYANSFNRATGKTEDRRSKVYRVEGATRDNLATREQNGVWQIIKAIVDDQLDSRRIANSDITRPDGTLLEQIYKVCQEPFVEFWGDTYSDLYRFIARQPPFTLSQIINYIDNNIIIEIDGSNTFNVNLDWETEYYSWYQIKPQSSFLGNSSFIAAAYIPIVYLPEYIDAFGNHKKVVPDNYISYQALSGENGKTDTDKFREMVVNDFKYIIESTMYLPFTRRGSITITGGDRRIKRGMWVHYKPTNELFYVDSVTNNFGANKNSISRQTTINVSRGMVYDYIKGMGGLERDGKIVESGGKPVNISYFNLVNTDAIRETLLTSLGNGEVNVNTKYKSNFVVNKPVFDFFVKRLQFEPFLESL